MIAQNLAEATRNVLMNVGEGPHGRTWPAIADRLDQMAKTFERVDISAGDMAELVRWAIAEGLISGTTDLPPETDK